MKKRGSPCHRKSSDVADTTMAISHLKLSSAKNKQWNSETNLATHVPAVSVFSKQSQLSCPKPVQETDMQCITTNKCHDKLGNRTGQSLLGLSQLSQSQPALSFPLPDYSKVKSIVKAKIIAQRQQDHEYRSRKAAISSQPSVVNLDSVDHSFAVKSDLEPTYQELVDELKDRHDQDRKFHELQNRYIQLANRYAEAETFIDKIRFLTPDQVGNCSEIRRFISLEELHQTQPFRSSVNLPIHQPLSNQQLSRSLDLINTNEPAEKLYETNQDKSFKLLDTTSFYQDRVKMTYLCEQVSEDLPNLEDNRSFMFESESATVVVDEQTVTVSECEQVKRSPKLHDQHLQMVITEKFVPVIGDHTDVTRFGKTGFLNCSQLDSQSPCSSTSTVNSRQVIMSPTTTSSIQEDQNTLEVVSQEGFPQTECYGMHVGNEQLHLVGNVGRNNEAHDGNAEGHVPIDVPTNSHSEFVDKTDLKMDQPVCNGAKRMLRFGCEPTCKAVSKDNASQSCYKCTKSIDTFVCDFGMHNIGEHNHALQPYHNLKHGVDLHDRLDTLALSFKSLNHHHHDIKVTGADARSLEVPGYECIEHSSSDQCAEAVEHSTDSPVLSDDSAGTLSPCRKVELWQASSAPQSEHSYDRELRRLTGMVYSLHEEMSSVHQLVSRLQRSPSSSSSLTSSPQSEQRRQRYLRKMFTIQQPLLPDKFPVKPAAGRWDISRPPYGDLRSPYAEDVTTELTVRVEAFPAGTVKTLNQAVQAGAVEEFESACKLSEGSNDSTPKTLIKQNSVDTADRIHHLAHKVRLKSGHVLRRLTESALL